MASYGQYGRNAEGNNRKRAVEGRDHQCSKTAHSMMISRIYIVFGLILHDSLSTASKVSHETDCSFINFSHKPSGEEQSINSMHTVLNIKSG